MEMSPSKRKILDEALKLFSINGYEATSIGQIMDAVGIKKRLCIVISNPSRKYWIH